MRLWGLRSLKAGEWDRQWCNSVWIWRCESQALWGQRREKLGIPAEEEENLLFPAFVFHLSLQGMGQYHPQRWGSPESNAGPFHTYQHTRSRSDVLPASGHPRGQSRWHREFITTEYIQVGWFVCLSILNAEILKEHFQFYYCGFKFKACFSDSERSKINQWVYYVNL